MIEANPAAVMQPNNNGATPAFIAAQEGQLECLNALHAAGEKMPEDRTFFSDEAKSLLNTLRNTHAVTALSFLREGSAVTNEALDTIQSEI